MGCVYIEREMSADDRNHYTYKHHFLPKHANKNVGSGSDFPEGLKNCFMETKILLKTFHQRKLGKYNSKRVSSPGFEPGASGIELELSFEPEYSIAKTNRVLSDLSPV